jgi:putative acyl-CoA dehydrogenase
MSNHYQINQALEDYDISDYKGSQGKNFYSEDRGLQRMIQRYTKGFTSEHRAAIQTHLEGFGELGGGILNTLTEACHKEGKYGELEKFDRTGNRIDNIVYSQEQLESRRIHYEYGIVNLDFHPEWKYEFPHIHRYALAYMANMNGEAGVTCPLAMTDGMILALKKIGTDIQKDKYLPLAAGKGSSSHFMCGQYITERVGGSNVGANRTIAEKREDGKWILTGEKWFCSNPGDLWVTTAKIEGTNTIGMFLVSRFLDDGSLNYHHILRKKDIIGSKGKLTTEIVYDGVVAEELGRPGHGIANLIRYVIKTSRIHVGLGACGNSRRAVMEALEYAKWRTAYGRKIQDFPAYTKLLVEMQVIQTSTLFASFRMVDAAEKEVHLQDVLIPLMKYKSSSQATDICRTAILCLGGNGIIGDFSPVPRMLDDSIINESWEGTHLIITDHFLHAISKRRVREAFDMELDHNIQNSEKYKILEYPLSIFQKKRSMWENWMNQPKEWKSMNRVFLADRSYEIFALSLFIQESVQDLDEKKEDSVYPIFAEAYAEWMEEGRDGLRNPEAAFLNPDKAQLIINY